MRVTMTEFDNLKRNYTLTIQLGLASKSGYHEAKTANELLHHFCENLVENSPYNDMDKASMKLELKLLKEALSEEIKHAYGKC